MSTQTVLNDKNNPNALKIEDGFSSFKNYIIGAVLLVVCVVAYNLYKGNQLKSVELLGDEIYRFEKEHLNPVAEKKEGASVEQMVTEMNNLFSQKGVETGALTAISLRVSDLLLEQNKDQEAREILSKALKNTKNDFSKYFLVSRLAVIQQNAGQTEEAIKNYESLLTQKHSIMMDKTYLDLGIAFQKVGNTEKAKSSFNYVLEKSKDEVMLKIARLYLNDLNK